MSCSLLPWPNPYHHLVIYGQLSQILAFGLDDQRSTLPAGIVEIERQDVTEVARPVQPVRDGMWPVLALTSTHPYLPEG